jgi:iron(III) transport system permease protein
MFRGFLALTFSILVFGPLVTLMLGGSDTDSLSALVRAVGIKSIPLLTTTCLTGLVATTSALILGLPLALILSSLPKRGGIVLALFFLPLVVPPYLNAECWTEFFFQSGLGRAGHDLLVWTGFSPKGQNILKAGLLLGYSYFPILAYTSYSGLTSLARGYKEAASLVLSPSRVFLRIILPMIRPHIITGCLLVFILAMTNYAIPSLIGVKTYPVKIYTSFSIHQDSLRALALALPFLVLCLGLIALLDRFLTRGCYFSLAAGGNQTTRQSCAWYFQIIVLGLGLLCIMPFASLVVRVRSWNILLTAFNEAQGALATSLGAALTCSLLLALCGLFMGYEGQRNRFVRSGPIRSLLLFSFALPGVLHAIGIIGLWNRPSLAWGYHSALVFFLLWSARYLPVVQRITMDQVAQIPTGMEETAFVARLKPMTAWTRIIFPLVRPTFFLVWGVTFVLTMTDLGGLLLVVPPGFETLPMRVYNLMHYGSSEMVAATAIVLACACIIPVLALSLASHVFGKKING